MSYKAHVLAFGPYSAEIADCLEFPAEFYKHVPASYIVTVTLFDARGPHMCEQLARCFGFEMLDFHKHVIHARGKGSSKVNFDMLESRWGDDAEVLKRLAKIGFTFLYLLEQ